MKLIDFHKYYPNEKSCRKAFKQNENKKASIVKNVVQESIIGKTRENNGNVKTYKYQGRLPCYQ